MRHDGGDGAGGTAEARLRALQRDAARIQHEINNPLAALLAEAQLLQLSLEQAPADPELLANAGRVVDLARRVIGCVRGLDAIRGSESPP